jgi:type II secretory pathway pseudopilin PulG
MRRLSSGYWLDGRGSCKGVEGDLRAEERHGEQGFMLVGLIVAIFIVLMVLGIAAPKMAQELRRDREVEAMHRGNQYVRAIQLYYRKSGSYPGTMDSLAKGTPVKFLRQPYVDPFTGKSDWRLIHVGEAKTTVKGFFGQPLTGLAPGLGSAAGSASSGSIGAGAAGSGSAFGGSSGSAFGGSSGSGSPTLGGSSGAGGSSGSAFGGSSGSGSPTLGGSSGSGGTSSSGPGYGSTTGAGTPTAGGATTGTDSSGSGSTPTGSNSTLGSAAGIASQSGSGFGVGGAPFVGVGIPKEGTSIVVLNEQTSYNTWEFIYDPRIEQMKAAAGLLGGGNQGLGSAGGMNSGVGGTGPGPSGFGSSGTSGYGSSGSSAFGSSSGSSFGSPSSGSSPTSGFGSSPSSGTQGSGTTPPTPQQPQ